MKKMAMTAAALCLLALANGQQKEGTVIFERTTQMQIRLNGPGSEEMQNMLPRQRKDNFELNFGNNQSVWKQAERENDNADEFNNGGMQIRMIGGGTDDVLYNNFDNKTRVELREMFDKKFIIDDSIRSLKWKITTETKMILNHNCVKATTTQTTTRMQMNMENGKMERKAVEDTALVVAWFATDIPVSAGPAEYQGQLPGLILEMDVANGRQVFKALEISPKVTLASIKAPTGKKHYTREEYRKEVDKMMDEMQRNGGGPGRVMRIGG